jgi:hypothetical protein
MKVKIIKVDNEHINAEDESGKCFLGTANLKDSEQNCAGCLGAGSQKVSDWSNNCCLVKLRLRNLKLKTLLMYQMIT